MEQGKKNDRENTCLGQNNLMHGTGDCESKNVNV